MLINETINIIQKFDKQIIEGLRKITDKTGNLGNVYNLSKKIRVFKHFVLKSF